MTVWTLGFDQALGQDSAHLVEIHIARSLSLCRSAPHTLSWPQTPEALTELKKVLQGKITTEDCRLQTSEKASWKKSHTLSCQSVEIGWPLTEDGNSSFAGAWCPLEVMAEITG